MKRTTVLFLILLGCIAGFASAEPPATRPAAASAFGDQYYLNRCPQCQRYLGTRGDPVEKYYQQRHVRFCHADCQAEFEANLQESLARLDAFMIADQLPWYPLSRCLVSDVALPAKPHDLIYRNRLLRLADHAAVDRFMQDPDGFMEKLDEATIAFHAPQYWISKCPEQGTRLEARIEPQLTVVCASRIVRVCCRDCYDRVIERPSNYLPLIDHAIRSGPAGKPDDSPRK
jgi:hypothetical protein